ncbi:hypothetical protein CYMTET_44483 [Cymbomonas tetramitiformis]|uniref:Uncharacterized protein n=1 Tax=Cymbomonas tetramitiformis TaxID=36881 RepID=A0AAE0F0M5_9CHLO|nr:hypothetical protein CYMTET_44483 [Cymbomonas tetramitiformis]
MHTPCNTLRQYHIPPYTYVRTTPAAAVAEVATTATTTAREHYNDQVAKVKQIYKEGQHRVWAKALREDILGGKDVRRKNTDDTTTLALGAWRWSGAAQVVKAIGYRVGISATQVVATVPPVGALYGAPHGRKRTSMRHTRHYFVTGGMEEQAFAVVAGDIFFGTCSTDYYGTACEKDSVLDSEVAFRPQALPPLFDLGQFFFSRSHAYCAVSASALQGVATGFSSRTNINSVTAESSSVWETCACPRDASALMAWYIPTDGAP